MTAFVADGPDIPERLLQNHEEGGVVFFCGAGISYPARLPSYKGLTEQLYKSLKPAPTGVQQSALDDEKYDTAIGLLENDIVGGRKTVRNKIAEILTPELSAPGATDTHKALLCLAEDRKQQLRLVTTNFDRIFDKVIPAIKTVCRAPLLPVPKARWKGLVYLHGVIPEDGNEDDLDQIVVSSGDFGLAYLTERWASRFVGELFRNYTVCFVGYSIDDPVLRYMMDALAADRVRGEVTREMFAFGSFSEGQYERRLKEWGAKNVTPILYQDDNGSHQRLHNTL